MSGKRICIRLRGGRADGVIVHHVCSDPESLPGAWRAAFGNALFKPLRVMMYRPLFDPPGHLYRMPDGEIDFAPGMRAMDDGPGGHDREHTPDSRCVVYIYDTDY